MKRVTVASAVVGVALAVSSSAVAQDWAKANLAKSPRHGEFVTINEAGGRQLQAWVVYPEVKNKAPVVVMIHEIFGMSDWAREMADELAGAGYIVVEPDLLSGFGPPKMSAEMQSAPHIVHATYEPQQGPPQQYHGDHPGLADAQNAGASSSRACGLSRAASRTAAASTCLLRLSRSDRREPDRLRARLRHPLHGGHLQAHVPPCAGAR